MPSIGINISDKLINILLNIKHELEQKEHGVLELDDLIEDAILNYYNISLVDLEEQSTDSKILHSVDFKSNADKERLYLILDALNSYKFKRDVAKKFSISERTLYRYIKDFNIKKNENNEYSIIV